MMRAALERLDGMLMTSLPVDLTPGWLRLVRGQYAAENALMYLRVARWLAVNEVEGDVFEFGVGSGASFCLIYRYLERTDARHSRRFFLFDSFEGLPESPAGDQHPQWKQGRWSYDQSFVLARSQRYGIDPCRVVMVPGYYEASLASELASRLNTTRVALLHIDCDLFSSAKAALGFVTPYVQDGTVVLLDDYFCYSGNPKRGEAAAFREWCQANSVEAVQWQPYSLHGNSYLLTIR